MKLILTVVANPKKIVIDLLNLYCKLECFEAGKNEMRMGKKFFFELVEKYPTSFAKAVDDNDAKHQNSTL
jgi:hypothetical protein